MRWFLVLVLGAACGGGEASSDAGAPPESDAGPGHCPVFGVTLSGARIPGGTLTLAAQDDDSGPFTLQWSVSAGEITQANPATWTLPEDLADVAPETVTWTLTIGGVGCSPLGGDVEIAWPAGHRAVVIYNPAVDGSEAIATSYAGFRLIPSSHVCGVAAGDATSLPGAELDAFVDGVMACVDAAGPQVTMIVPVFGVPYKVQGRIDDIASPGTKVETSLDALLVFGDAAKTMETYALNPLYREGDSMAGVYDAYVPFPELRAGVAPYYLVTRLDGADAGFAMALIDRTIEAEALAETCGLAGTVYVDARLGAEPPATDDYGSYEAGEWNILGVANVFAPTDFPVIVDYNDAELGTAPAPLTAPDALFYAGWYSFANYNDVFTWNPGAIGGHLDSCSACDLRGDRDWSAMALQRGITATFGAVNEPYVLGMPEYDQFFLYLLQGASFAEAAYESTTLGAWMMVWVGDPMYRPFRSCP